MRDTDTDQTYQSAKSHLFMTKCVTEVKCFHVYRIFNSGDKNVQKKMELLNSMRVPWTAILKEINPEYSFARTDAKVPILWPPDAKS